MKSLALAFCIFALHGASAAAQTTPADPPPDPKPQTSTIDPSKLPVSLRNIRNELATQPGAKTSGLKIQETIEVVGIAPKMPLWNPETAKLATGPVPWGAPTHRDFIDLVTPQEFKNYPMDINALLQWLLQHFAEKTSKSDGKTSE